MSSDAAATISREARLDDRARWMRSGDDWCVAHWHAAPMARRASRILCPSIGSERMRGERAFRVLGRSARGARRVYAPLRLSRDREQYRRRDRRGPSRSPTLSSAGAGRSPTRRRMRRQLVPGAEIVLVGRRLGALLAMEASRSMPRKRDEVRALGSAGVGAHLRARAAAARVGTLRSPLRRGARVRASDVISLQWEGHRFDRRTVEAIERLTLGERVRARRCVDVVASDPDRAVNSLARSAGLRRDRSRRRASRGRRGVRLERLRRTRAAGGCSRRHRGVRAGRRTSRERRRRDARGPPARIRRFVTGRSARSRGARALRSSGCAVRRERRRVRRAPSPTTAALILPTGNRTVVRDTATCGRDSPARAAEQGVPTLRMDWRGNGESLPHPARSGKRELRAAPDGRRVGGNRLASRALPRRVDRRRGTVQRRLLRRSRRRGRRRTPIGVIAINPQLYWHEGMPTQLDRRRPRASCRDAARGRSRARA